MMKKLPIIERASYARGFKKSGESSKRSSFFVFSLIISVLFLVVIFRLFQLTVVKGDYYRRMSDENRVREIVIEPKRGTILDRNDVVVAYNTVPNYKASGDHIGTKRTYIGGNSIGHIIGYEALADKSDIVNDNCLTSLEPGDKTGKKGVESVYDCDLRGRRGKKLIELDARGKEIKTLGLIPPQPGKDIHLALDMALQQKAYDLISSSSATRAAVVATKPNTGEVYVLTSTPGYNPQVFEDGDQVKMKEYLTAGNHPMFNRATEGAYPPGSIFKLVVATGALEDKKIDENFIVNDTGFLKVGPATYNNWFYTDYGKTEGDVNIVKAIQRSNDTFFYKTGEKLGESRIKHWSENFGLGQKVPFPFEQADGLIPSPFWKEEKLKEDWFTGDTYNFSIGQGYVLATPLQMHQVGSVFANKGTVCDPQLLKNAYPLCHSMKLSDKTIDIIRTGMHKACETGGTAWPLFDFSVNGKKIPLGCKTGTAETPGPNQPEPHAWFTVFAPFDDPQIQVTVLIENGGQGSSVAAPIAKEVLKTFFGENGK